MSSFVKPNIDKTLYLWSKNAKKSYDGTGMVNSLTLNNGGSGYTFMPNVSFSGGNGIDATAVAVDGVVNNINITNAGNYTETPSSVELRNGGGTGATAVIGMSLSGIRRINAGSGYTTTPIVNISPPDIAGGIQAAATCSMAGDKINFYIISDYGSGYTSPPTVTITGGGGSGAIATAVLGTSGVGYVDIPIGGGGAGYVSQSLSITGGAIFWITASSGVITSVSVLSCGSGYTSPPTITPAGGDGNAVLQAVLKKPVITHIQVTNAGTNYTSSPDVVFIGGTSITPATAIATLSLSKLQLINSGNLYTSPPTVSFTGGGGGSGASATTTINTPSTNKCLEYKWDIPEISLNDSGKISVVGRSYTSFNQTALPISTRLKNIASSKYNYNSKNGEGVVLDVKPWDYSFPSTKCPPIPLAPQSINEISLYLQDENDNLKGIYAYNDFVIVLKVEEDDVPEARWGSTNAVNVRQMSIPTYN